MCVHENAKWLQCVCTGENQLLAENVLVCEAHVYRPACVCVYEYEGGGRVDQQRKVGRRLRARERERGERRGRDQRDIYRVARFRLNFRPVLSFSIPCESLHGCVALPKLLRFRRENTLINAALLRPSRIYCTALHDIIIYLC